jgi:hypothetical protein
MMLAVQPTILPPALLVSAAATGLDYPISFIGRRDEQRAISCSTGLQLPIDIPAWINDVRQEVPELAEIYLIIDSGNPGINVAFPGDAVRLFVDAARHALVALPDGQGDVTIAADRLGVLVRPGLTTAAVYTRCPPLFSVAQAMYASIDEWLKNCHNESIAFHLLSYSAHERLARSADGGLPADLEIFRDVTS